MPLVFGAVAFGMPVRGKRFISHRRWRAFGALALGHCLDWPDGRSRVRMSKQFRADEPDMVPMWVLVGVFFAASNFTDAVQPFIRCSR